jgi:hypothetical protein
MSYDWLFIVGLIVFMLLGMWVLPRFLMQRAMRQVIDILRRNNAINMQNAKTVEELGLQPRSFMESMTRMRDYKPRALQVLVMSEVVNQTEDGKVYLSEEKLQETKLGIR